MTGPANKTLSASPNKLRLTGWRIIAWLMATLLVLLPLIAMQFTDEVNWNLADFLVFGLLVFSIGFALEIFISKSGNTIYRIAAGLGLCGVFLLVWLSLGVGVIGSDGGSANLLYLLVIAVGTVGTLVAKFQPSGMARTLVAVAISQTLVTVIAAVAFVEFASSEWSKLALLNGFFIVLFSVVAWLFHRSAKH